MLLFFLIEKIARLRMGGSSGGHGHSHGRGHSHSAGKEEVEEDEHPQGQEGPAAAVLRRRRGKNGGDFPSSPSPSPVISHEASTPSTSASLVGILNLIADLSHNFTDGLAISASFLSSPTVGLSTTLAVLIHEVPHEIGDFAILMQAGYTIQQAMGFQLLTAVGALMGVGVVWLGGGTGGEGMEWVLPVTAGGFIYVGLVNVVPGVLQEEKERQQGIGKWLQAVGEVAAMFVGVGLMVLIGLLE